MDIFFTSKHKYIITDSIDNVREEIKSIADSKWYKASDNITGSIKDNNSFRLTQKWSFAAIQWIERSPAYLNGTLLAEDNRTIINTTLRPNSALIIFFYLLAILFICELFGVDTFVGGSKIFKLLFFPFFNLILLGLMQLYTTGLRKRFERLLHIRNAK